MNIDQLSVMVKVEMLVIIIMGESDESSTIIDLHTSQWDVDDLNSLFLPEDVSEILKIPLGVGRSDSLMWHYSSNGRYTVRSANRLAMAKRQLEVEALEGCSSSEIRNLNFNLGA